MVPGQVRFGPRIAWMLIGAGAVFLLSKAFLKAPCWGLYFLAAAIAMPIWHDLKEYPAFHRQTFLERVALEGSWVRRWFWAGHFGAACKVIAALGWAVLLLVFSALLSPERWVVIAADVLILAALAVPISRGLAGQVRSEHVGLVARTWPLRWLNTAVLTIGFLVLDFVLIGAPDTRGKPWNVVAESAFLESFATAACAGAGMLVGFLSMIDRLIWHASEVLIPTLPRVELKLLAWALLLLKVGIFSLAVTRFELGVIAWVERRAQQRTGPSGARPDSTTFVWMSLALAVPFLGVVYSLRDFDPASWTTGGRKVVSWANPCRADPKAIEDVKAKFGAEIDSVRAAAKRWSDQQIDTTVDPLFAEVEQGVDRYLDWYFSVPGEYQRLAAWAVGNLAGRITAELDQRLFGDFGFAARVESASKQIAEGTALHMSAIAAEIGIQLKSELENKPCGLEAINPVKFDTFDRDLRRVVVAGSAGVGVGLATGMAARTAAAVARNVAAKEAAQGGARLAAGAAARRVAPSIGVAGFCGPWAPLCAVGAGVVTWLMVDQALVKIDELRFRSDMRAELLESVYGQKAELVKGLRAMNNAAIDEMASGMHKSVDGAFIPVRDGL